VAHGQLNQNGPSALQEALWSRMTELVGVRPGPSGISAPATRALHLDAALALGPPAAFIVGTEFAHLHGREDGSLHATLPEALADITIRHGWGELHPLARAGQRPPTLMMLYSPRDASELENVWRLVQASYAFARGD
jgi:phospholipase/carboxylesterase